MAPRARKRSGESTTQQRDADRYREAAEAALEQLDWVINYLRGIRKVEVSRALAQNRTYIRQQLRDGSD
jgi:hypothetical protein